jgi:hypothetical protein
VKDKLFLVAVALVMASAAFLSIHLATYMADHDAPPPHSETP